MTTPLDNGGVVLVVGTRTTNISDEWKDHPRVVLWDSTNPDTKHRDVPTNVKAIIFSRWVSHSLFDRIMAVARDRRLTTYPQLTTGTINQRIAELLGATPTPRVKVIKANRGQIRDLILAEANFSAPPQDEAQRLFLMARERGIPTTIPSLLVAIRKLRRDQRKTGVPLSIQPKMTPTQAVTRALDDAIAGLQLVRETIVTMETENAELRRKIEIIRGL